MVPNMALGFTQLALIVASLLAAVVFGVLLAQRRSAGKARCPACGAVKVNQEGSCNVCQAPFEAPAGRPDTSVPHDERNRQRRPPGEPTVDPDLGVLNPGIRPWMVRWAFGLMIVGLGTRLLGMLEPAGLDLGVPVAITAALTVLGGVGMFLGFIVLDVA